MALIGNDFVIVKESKAVTCSECNKRVPAGENSKVSMRKGKVKKRLCMDEECRLKFDDEFWQTAANENSRRRKQLANKKQSLGRNKK